MFLSIAVVMEASEMQSVALVGVACSSLARRVTGRSRSDVDDK